MSHCVYCAMPVCCVLLCGLYSYNLTARCMYFAVFFLTTGSGDSAIYDSELFERRCPVLKHFVDNDDCLQEEIIYGLQVTLSRKKHPKGQTIDLCWCIHINVCVGPGIHFLVVGWRYQYNTYSVLNFQNILCISSYSVEYSAQLFQFFKNVYIHCTV